MIRLFVDGNLGAGEPLEPRAKSAVTAIRGTGCVFFLSRQA